MSERKKSASSIAPVYLVVSGERTIEATPEETWPFLLDYPSWQGFSRVETIEGQPGAEGEVVALIKEEAGFVFPPYFARTIKIEPGRKLIWKTFIEPQPDEIDLFGIVEFRLYPQGDQTVFWYNLIYEFQVPYDDPQELEQFKATQHENFDALINSTHPKLKQLVESSRRRRPAAF